MMYGKLKYRKSHIQNYQLMPDAAFRSGTERNPYDTK